MLSPIRPNPIMPSCKAVLRRWPRRRSTQALSARLLAKRKTHHALFGPYMSVRYRTPSRIHFEPDSCVCQRTDVGHRCRYLQHGPENSLGPLQRCWQLAGPHRELDFETTALASALWRGRHGRRAGSGIARLRTTRFSGSGRDHFPPLSIRPGRSQTLPAQAVHSYSCRALRRTGCRQSLEASCQRGELHVAAWPPISVPALPGGAGWQGIPEPDPTTQAVRPTSSIAKTSNTRMPA